MLKFSLEMESVNLYLAFAHLALETRRSLTASTLVIYYYANLYAICEPMALQAFLRVLGEGMNSTIEQTAMLCGPVSDRAITRVPGSAIKRLLQAKLC